jgi:hypothetical protein
MNTAKAYFEIYKSLPQTVKSKVFSMIIKEENALLSEIEQSLKEVDLMNNGLKQKRNVKDLIQSFER